MSNVTRAIKSNQKLIKYLREKGVINQDSMDMTIILGDNTRYSLVELIQEAPVLGCQCFNENQLGETTVFCCNNCGKPVEEFWI